LREERL